MKNDPDFVMTVGNEDFAEEVTQKYITTLSLVAPLPS